MSGSRSSALYPTRGARGRAIVGWCMFDFANSAYTTLIITVAYSVYFREAVVAAGDNSGDRLWGIADFIAMGTVAVISPFLGALADHSGRKKAFLLALTLLSVGATAAMALVDPGEIVLGMALFVLGTIGFEAGYVFYNAFLPEISTPRSVGRISGWAWGIGFVGGLTALVLCRPWLASALTDADGKILPGGVDDRQLSFLIVAVFFALFSLPAFVWLRENRSAAAPGRPTLAIGWQRVRSTVTQLRRYRETAKFIFASLFFNDGITTIIRFSAIYATVTFGFGPGELIDLFLVLNLVALPAAVLSGYAADRFGAKRTLMATLALWVLVVLLGASATTKGGFWLMAVGAAIGMGSAQSVARAFMAQITPPNRESEFFGFYVLSGKFAALFGPLIFGFVSAASGSQRLAVLTVAPLFVLGFVLLATIDDQAAIEAANAP